MRPKVAIFLNWAKLSASDPKATFNDCCANVRFFDDWEEHQLPNRSRRVGHSYNRLISEVL